MKDNKYKYTTAQVNKALSLVNSGLSRKEAARKAKMGVYAVNYYISKSSPKLKKILLRKRHLRAFKTLQSLFA